MVAGVREVVLLLVVVLIQSLPTADASTAARSASYGAAAFVSSSGRGGRTTAAAVTNTRTKKITRYLYHLRQQVCTSTKKNQQNRRRRRRRPLASVLMTPTWQQQDRIILRSSTTNQQQECDEGDDDTTSLYNRDDDDDDCDGSILLVKEQTLEERYSPYLPKWLLTKASQLGYVYPTRIQKQAFDAILMEGKTDVIVQAETGSGKTLAYLLPTLANIDSNRAAIQALIVVPTRELGLQVAKVAKRLNNNNQNNNKKKIMIMNVLQGSQNRRQRAWAWAEPPHIVIGTPQELCDMVRFGGIKRYNSVKTVVVDEVDACLLNNAGSFSSSVSSSMSSSTLHELLSKYLSPTYDDGSSQGVDDNSATAALQRSSARNGKNNPRPVSHNRQTIFYSATIPQHRHFLKQCVQNKWMLQPDPVYVSLRRRSGIGQQRQQQRFMPSTLQHAYVVCTSNENKLSTLRRLVQKISSSSSSAAAKVLIFCEPHRPMEEMAVALVRDVPNGGGLYWRETCKSEGDGISSAIVSVLRFEDSLSQRAAAIDSFRGGGNDSDDDGAAFTNNKHTKLRVLLSTDLAARGLDIVDITHVIHFDLPPDADTYLHRSGRTGRFGRRGQVISILPPEQEFVLQRITNKLNVRAKCIGRQQQKQQQQKQQQQKSSG